MEILVGTDCLTSLRGLRRVARESVLASLVMLSMVTDGEAENIQDESDPKFDTTTSETLGTVDRCVPLWCWCLRNYRKEETRFRSECTAQSATTGAWRHRLPQRPARSWRAISLATTDTTWCSP